MRIQLRLFSILQECLPSDTPRGPVPVELPEGSSLRDLVVRLGIDRRLGCDATELAGRAGWQVLVNGSYEAEMGRTLRDGDWVQIFPPVAGGDRMAAVDSVEARV